ncbi:hypothetical protein HMPREF0970_00358 [Schaalia odontolytica F0309]|uniref:Uncharacterized protein n=1 Tax=Schaalia odontolytica F0309 TaxID=649742 RepID=D4TWP7_9ACTO|nr:hypothetical protein HMPREF0970_00358 [Schaalia odontolytica F0309]
MRIWIGYCVLDSLFSYPERRFLSRTSFPIQNRARLASWGATHVKTPRSRTCATMSAPP